MILRITSVTTICFLLTMDFTEEQKSSEVQEIVWERGCLGITYETTSDEAEENSVKTMTREGSHTETCLGYEMDVPIIKYVDKNVGHPNVQRQQNENLNITIVDGLIKVVVPTVEEAILSGLISNFHPGEDVVLLIYILGAGQRARTADNFNGTSENLIEKLMNFLNKLTEHYTSEKQRRRRLHFPARP